MSSKIVEIVCKNNGENVGTYSPFCFLESFTEDINEKCTRCLSYDDNRLVETGLYLLSKVRIPEWMDEVFYLQHLVKFHFTICLLKDWGYSLTKEQMLRTFELTEEYKYFFGWLFNCNTKNQFKLDIRLKCLDWLNGDNKYKLPLSTSQFIVATKFCPLYDAGKITNRLYYSNSYWLT